MRAAMHRSVLLIAILVVGCNKKSEAPAAGSGSAPAAPAPAAKPVPTPPAAAPTEAAAPTAAAPPRAVSGECPAGAWKNEAKDQPQFCLSLPKGYALDAKGVEKKSHHEWSYTFRGEGDYRPELHVMVQGYAKPGVTGWIDARGPFDDVKVVKDETVPAGKRVVTRSADYDKDEYGMENEYVALSKNETVDVSKECGACPPWEWIVTCFSSTAKQAAPEDREPCRTIQMP